VISHGSIFSSSPRCGSSICTRGQAAGRVGQVGDRVIGQSPRGSTHIVVVVVLVLVADAASKGKSFGSGEQCQNWRESPKASGSTNSYDDVTW